MLTVSLQVHRAAAAANALQQDKMIYNLTNEAHRTQLDLLLPPLQ